MKNKHLVRRGLKEMANQFKVRLVIRRRRAKKLKELKKVKKVVYPRLQPT